MMVQYGPYEFSETEVVKLTEYLSDRARQQMVIHHDDAYVVVRQYGLYYGPHDQRLWHLLGLISEAEVAAGDMLCPQSLSLRVELVQIPPALASLS